MYTVLTGRYETLNEQPVATQSDADFLCFTDDPTLASETWRIQVIAPFLPEDPVRSQREAKLRAHRYLPDYDVSLYIDNSVLLTERPEEFLAELLPEGAGLGLLEHSFRSTVADEFEAVISGRVDSAVRCDEQHQHYRRRHPEALTLRPLWSGVLARRHHDPLVVEAMERWFTHVLRYSRRDQLSNRIAFLEAGLTPTVVPLDNHLSPFHRWPVVSGRSGATRTGAWTAEDDLVRELEARLAAIEQSRSWRMTSPLRRLRFAREGR